MFLLRNYNKFLVGSPSSFQWVDFYIHRFPSDFDKLLLFPSVQEAQQFLDQHLDVEIRFDAWILETSRSEWSEREPTPTIKA
jgi:hypothetical protein